MRCLKNKTGLAVFVLLLALSPYTAKAQQVGAPTSVIPGNIIGSMGKFTDRMKERLAVVRDCAAKQGVDLPVIDMPMQQPLKLTDEEKKVVDTCMKQSNLAQPAVAVGQGGVPLSFETKYKRISVCAAAKGVKMPEFGKPMPVFSKEQAAVVSQCAADVGGSDAVNPVTPMNADQITNIQKCAAEQGLKLPEPSPTQPPVVLNEHDSDILRACYKTLSSAESQQ